MQRLSGFEAQVTGPSLAQLLRDRRDQIVARFVSEVERADLSPQGIARSRLVDHIPKFLDEIIAELTTGSAVRMSQDAVDTSETARQHGEQRWSLGYDLEALMREYGVLRHCILITAKEENAQLSIDEHDVLAKCLSVGVTQAATEYVAYRDVELNAQKANLQFLAEAGQLLSSSLDYRSTLSRLMGLIVPRMADWCALHLEGQGADEMRITHVDPAMIDVLREVYRAYPFDGDSPRGFPRVLQTGEPSLVASIDPEFWAPVASNPALLERIRRVGTVSRVIVPLRIQGHVFGAMTLAYSQSGRHYGETDLAFVSELASRAAVAIDNARLYDLSQNERSRVEAATRAKDEFVAMVSHELRTPLNSVLGWLRLIRRGSMTPEKQKHALEVIERNAQAQSLLVSDLLDISRIITGQIRISPSQVDLGNVVDMAMEGVRPAAEAKRIQLEVDIDRSNAIMRGDADRLQQVVWNLLANAVKFTPKNGRVRVLVRRVESDLEVTVEDNGAGIAAEFLPFVFESFRQSDGTTTRAHGGLGIGLSIAKHIVELHGGTVDAESPGVGKGAIFRVRLPISPLVSTTMGVARVPATQAKDPSTPPPARQEGTKVLVVDDDADARELVTYVFEAAGMEVRAAASVRDALSELEKFTPHVIVSDIGMPIEDGYALIRGVRTLSNEEKKRIPAIALTAFARNEDRTRALVEGFNAHIAKPVEPTALVQAVVELAGHVRR